MVALNTAYASSKTFERSQNRAGDFFCEGADCIENNQPGSRIAAKEKSVYTYETASGRPFWPNRDPIGEIGSIPWLARVSAINAQLSSRDLSPAIARMLQDYLFTPTERFEGPNIYCMLKNDSINEFDILGLTTTSNIFGPLLRRIDKAYSGCSGKTGCIGNKSKCTTCCGLVSVGLSSAATAVFVSGNVACLGAGGPFRVAACYAAVYDAFGVTLSRISSADSNCKSGCPTQDSDCPCPSSSN